MKLAGNVTVPGVIAGFGDVVMKGNYRRHGNGILWIPPVSRIQEELGMEARWSGDGTATLVYPGGDEVELVKEHGMAFIERAHCWPIRHMLAQSQLLQRKKHVQQTSAATVEPHRFTEMRV